VLSKSCTACDCLTEVLAFARVSSVVDYYLCKGCGHIWSVRKNDPPIIDHFMRPPQKPK